MNDERAVVLIKWPVAPPSFPATPSAPPIEPSMALAIADGT
jgi:hypothetical protein